MEAEASEIATNAVVLIWEPSVGKHHPLSEAIVLVPSKDINTLNLPSW